jgi:hypothetical protein
MLRAGFDIPHLRVAIQGNIIGSSKKDGTTFKYSYISIVVSAGIGGGRRDKPMNNE